MLLFSAVIMGRPETVWAGQGPIQKWNKVSSQSLSSIAYGNGIYVAITSGSNPKLVTSTDLVNWTEQNIANLTKPFNVVKFINGTFVVGTNYSDPITQTGATFLFSNNGTNWDARTVSQPPQFSITSVVYGNNTYVASSYFGEITTSTNGVNWTPPVRIVDRLSEVKFINGYFVAVGYKEKNKTMPEMGGNDSISTSTNGASWTTTMLQAVNGGPGLSTVASNGNNVIGASFTSVYRFSASDLNNISNQTIQDFNNNFFIKKLVYANTDGGTYIIVGTGGKIITSADTNNWTDESISDATSDFMDVIEAENTAVAVGTIGVYKRVPQVVNATINPGTGSFDKNTANQADVTTTVTLNGNTLSGIANGGTTLTLDTDYTVSGSTVTIKKEYLARQSIGTTTLTFSFSGGADQTLSITVSDTTPQNSAINPVTANFDKNAANQVDVTTTVTLNGNTLSGIVNGGTALTLDTDYTVSGSTVTIKKEYLARQSIGTTTLTFSFSGGADQTLSITVSDTTSTSSGSATSTTPEITNNVDVLVNGKVENAGTAATSKRNGQTVTTIVVDQKKLDDKLAAEEKGAVITIPVAAKSDVFIGELNGQMVKNMEGKQAVVEIKTDKAAYTLPAQQINIDAVSDKIGKSVSLQDIKVQIEIAAPTADKVKVVEDAAEKGTFTLVVPSVEFTVKAIYGEKTVEVSAFNAYVHRTIAIPDGVDPNKITTGIVVEPDGSVRHVPTKIVVIDGKYYATINSLTNSTYSVVWHPLAFSDVANHWAKGAVNDMGSRMVIEGTGGGQFSPDRDITRAEFAAIIVRGLGLKLDNGAPPFSDVKATDWYSGAVNTAYAYKLIAGFEDGTFRPNDNITREQAMVVLSKAMKVTGLKDKLSVPSAVAVLRPFGDAAEVSPWAQSSVADSVQAGIVSGRSDAKLVPTDFMTRAEVATMIQKLLQKSGLI
uniref:SLH domain-containing protein n=2 Tax=Cohnella candidum TaxID=2674991 RepID=A0A3G3K5L7_9BACL|nr:hypothetical protein EAV92_19000 [Cohnella candidum]